MLTKIEIVANLIKLGSTLLQLKAPIYINSKASSTLVTGNLQALFTQT